jgi:cyclopropane fatty-acyl-phospholipid synthase-like methyltransferase
MTSHSDRVVSLYERHAHDFDADRTSDLSIERQWLDRFVRLLPPGATVLDLGCGSGVPVARHLIERGLHVTGVDSSPTLISLCRSRFRDRDWLVADMRTLDLGKTFDGLVAWDSFFHLSPADQRSMFSVFRKHAGPGSALLFTSGHAPYEHIGSYRNEPLYHASLAPLEYHSLLESNGFRVKAHISEDPDATGHTVWLAQDYL